MKFKIKQLQDYIPKVEPWFAWRPVIAFGDNNSVHLVWWEWVIRETDYHDGAYGVERSRNYHVCNQTT